MTTPVSVSPRGAISALMDGLLQSWSSSSFGSAEEFLEEEQQEDHLTARIDVINIGLTLDAYRGFGLHNELRSAEIHSPLTTTWNTCCSVRCCFARPAEVQVPSFGIQSGGLSRFSWESSRCPATSVSARTSAKCSSVLIVIFFTPNAPPKVDKRWRTSSFTVGVDQADWMMPDLRTQAPPTDRTRGLVDEMDSELSELHVFKLLAPPHLLELQLCRSPSISAEVAPRGETDTGVVINQRSSALKDMRGAASSSRLTAQAGLTRALHTFPHQTAS
ncbi:hypothetical protein AOLI_G00263370 [Acnodon oligacanthus]